MFFLIFNIFATALICDIEYENAPYPSCHLNNAGVNCCLFIHSDDSPFTIRIRSDTD